MAEVNTDPDTSATELASTTGGSALEVKFVGWEPGVDDAPRKHAPRLSHKKSRAGCQQCRARRVKCDEVHPVCGSCDRHKSGCVWGRDKAAINPAEPLPTRSRPLDIRPKASAPTTGAPELPESRERRLRELELLHHYTTVTSFGLNPDDPDHRLTQGVLVPRIALKNDSLLYSIFASAALHLAQLEPNEQKHVDSYQKYLGLAIRLHRDDVAKLGKENADATMLTTTVLRTVSFAVLRLRPMEPYTPAIEWLQMNYGTGPGLSVAAWKFLRDDPTSLMRAIIMKANVPGLNAKKPQLRDMPVIFNENNLQHLNHLLKRTPEQELDEPWDADILFAYNSTVSYIGGVLQAIAAGDRESTILRRLLLFPTMVEKTFIELVEEQRPRALVVLAHYFGLLARFRLLWWVGEAGPREVEAIQKVVGEEWQEDMLWPLKAIKEEPTSRPPEPDVLAVESRLDVVAKME